MGLLMDIRSGKRAAGTGGDAVLFWFLAGGVFAGVAGHLGGGSEKLAMTLGVAGAVAGLCVRYYAAFGATKLARALALPGCLIAFLH